MKQIEKYFNYVLILLIILISTLRYTDASEQIAPVEKDVEKLVKSGVINDSGDDNYINFIGSTRPTEEKSKIDILKEEKLIMDKKIEQYNNKNKDNLNTKTISDNVKQKNEIEVHNKIDEAKNNIVKNKYVNDVDKNITTIDIVSEIEKNLINKSKNTNVKDVKIEIKKGEWNNKDVVKINDTNKNAIEKTSAKFKITTQEDDDSKKIEELKRIAYKAAKSGEHEVAIKYCKEILKTNPKDNFAKLSLATSYHALKQFNQAKVIYVELMDVFPEDENIVSNLMSIMINESPYEAVYLIPLLAERYSNSSAIQAQTSIAFARVKDYKDAITYIKKAIHLDQNNKEYLYNLGVLYDLNGNYADAITIYKKIISEKYENNFFNKNELLARIKILSKEI